MNRTTCLVLLSAATTLTTTAAAQQRPDFSGVWVAPAERPAGPAGDARAPSGGMGAQFAIGNMGSGWGSPVTIDQGAERLTVEYQFFIAYDLQPPFRFIYALDGSETRNSVMMGRGVQEQHANVSWAGNTLVITTRHAFANPHDGTPMVAEVRQALTLESPTSLAVETTRVGVLGGPTTSTKTIYTKR